jgi:hypothetical protein
VLFSSLAAAATFEVSLAVVSPEPVFTELRGARVGGVSYAVAAGYPDQIIPSDWEHVTCRIEEGVVHVEFVAFPGDWPTSFPPTATCSAGGHTLIVHLVDEPMDSDYDLWFDPTVGLTIASAPKVGFGRTYLLPIGPGYVAGSWPAKLTPSTSWAGVTCSVGFRLDTGAPYFQVSADLVSPAASGYCELPSEAGAPHVIPLTITR